MTTPTTLPATPATTSPATSPATPPATSQSDTTRSPSLLSCVGRGVVAGLAGSVVMTAFQKFVEMPITGRSDSYAPAQLASKVLGVTPRSQEQLDALNYATHFALGATWGAVYGVVSYLGLRGSPAAAATFATVYSQDVATVTALGLDKPWEWSGKDLAIDVGDKLVQVAATSAIFDRVLTRS